MWFAYLATVHEIILRSVNAEEKKQLLKEMRGDGDFLKKYKESHLHHINISESTKLSIIECYRTSKSHIQNIYRHLDIESLDNANGTLVVVDYVSCRIS